MQDVTSRFSSDFPRWSPAIFSTTCTDCFFAARDIFLSENAGARPLKFDIAWSNACCSTLQRGIIKAAVLDAVPFTWRKNGCGLGRVCRVSVSLVHVYQLVRATDPGTGFARTLSRRAFCHSFREDHPSELPLSAWSRDTLSQPDCPLQWRADMDLGFSLCLDVPRSGLILCGTTFSGLLALRWQLGHPPSGAPVPGVRQWPSPS